MRFFYKKFARARGKVYNTFYVKLCLILPYNYSISSCFVNLQVTHKTTAKRKKTEVHHKLGWLVKSDRRNALKPVSLNGSAFEFSIDDTNFQEITDIN